MAKIVQFPLIPDQQVMKTTINNAINDMRTNAPIVNNISLVLEKDKDRITIMGTYVAAAATGIKAVDVISDWELSEDGNATLLARMNADYDPNNLGIQEIWQTRYGYQIALLASVYGTPPPAALGGYVPDYESYTSSDSVAANAISNQPFSFTEPASYSGLFMHVSVTTTGINIPMEMQLAQHWNGGATILRQDWGIQTSFTGTLTSPCSIQFYTIIPQADAGAIHIRCRRGATAGAAQNWDYTVTKIGYFL